ncbi:ABC transporter substrate-binding protein [Amycolatopsis albidoflavus]
MPDQERNPDMKIVLGRDDLAAAALEAAETAGASPERLGIRPVHKASRGFVNDGTADVCELAIVTLLQGVAYGKPVALLPITALGRHQHQTLVTLGEAGLAGVRGKTVGVRSWSQTTGVWLRGFLADDYGLDLSEVDWITYEDGHVPEYTDPSWTKRAPEGSKLPADFLDGKLDYGIMGNELPSDDRIRTAIPDALAVAEKWAERKGFAPINHVVAFDPAADAKAVLAIYDALAAQVRTGPAELNPVGFEGLRGPVTEVARYAFEQQVLPRAVSFDELVDRTCEALGVSASRLG